MSDFRRQFVKFNEDQWPTEEECKKFLQKKIYRIIPIKYAKEILKEKILRLRKPENWLDRHENYLAKAVYGIPNCRGSIDYTDLNFAKHHLADCWTLTDESDAMWQIYSEYAPNNCWCKCGIRLETTIEKLLITISKIDPNNVYVGEVKYCPRNKFIPLAQRTLPRIFESSGRKAAETLLLKRDAFEHEKEIRFIYTPNSDKGNLYPINLSDPSILFDSIMLDPRLDAHQENEQRQLLQSFGYPEHQICKSELYDELVPLIVSFKQSP